MELTPPSGALPGFFRPVRRRHPDVDIVLLPRPPAAEPGEPSAEAVTDRLAADLEAVALAVAEAWAAVTGGRPDVSARTAFGPREDAVVARARHRGTVLDPPGPALEAHLAAAGWEVAAPPPDAVLLRARRDGAELAATYAVGTGVLVLTVTSSPIPVGVDRARALVTP